MATVVIMPRNGQSVESCVITAWNKKVGDEVHVGDVLFSYETDKSSFDEEAKVDGTLLAAFYGEYDDVPCLNEVCVIGTPGEDISMFGKNGGEEAAPAAEEAPAAEAAPAAPEAAPEAPAAAAPAEGIAGVSPRARAAAEKLHVDLAAVIPSGPHGRIIERDILAAPKGTAAAAREGGMAGVEGTGIGGRVTTKDLEAAKAPAAAPAPAATKAPAPAAAAAPAAEGQGYHDEKIVRMRQIIGKSMKHSLNDIPQLTHMLSFDTAALTGYRKKLKAVPESMGLPKITYNDLMLFAVSRVIKAYPALNANTIDEKTMRFFDHVHLGMAVDTPRGLMVPTIFNADQKSLAQIAREAKDLAAQCQAGSISPDLLSGASFTISNVGTMGIEYFTPVINPPQTGILGVGGIIDKVKVVDGQLVPYKAMGLSLSFDHAAMDGALAAKFLKELKEALENFDALLAG